MAKSTIKRHSNISTIMLTVSDFSNGLDISNGQNITSMANSINSYNFSFNKGVLTEGLGVKNFLVPTQKLDENDAIEIYYDDFVYDVKSLLFYRGFSKIHGAQQDRVIIFASDNYIWHLALNVIYPSTSRLTKTFTQKPSGFNTRFNNKDILVLSNLVDDCAIFDGQSQPVTYANCPSMISLCEYKNRLYFITGQEQKVIRYTKNFDISSWEETLNLDFNEQAIEFNDGYGKLNKLINFKNYIYIFRDYAILKLSQYEDKNASPTCSNVYVSGAMIYPNTIQVCGDEIIMLTRDGLIRFDGVTVEKFKSSFDSMINKIDNRSAVASYHAGKYYIALKMNFNDDKKVGAELDENCKNNALLMFDLKENTYSICRGLDILDMLSVQTECLNKLMLCFNVGNTTKLAEVTENGKFFDTNSLKYWCSPLSDLGYSDKKKIVQEVSLISKYDAILTIFTEREKKSFKVKGSQTISKFPVRISGKQIGFKIETDSEKAYISNLKMKIGLIDNENLV